VLSMAVSLAAGLVFCRSSLRPSEGVAGWPVRERAPVLALAALYLIGFGFVLANRAAGMEIGDPSGAADPNQLRIAGDLVAAARVLWLFVAALGPLALLGLARQSRTEVSADDRERRFAARGPRRPSGAVRVGEITPPIG